MHIVHDITILIAFWVVFICNSTIYSVNLFHVRDDFPMISRGDISPGIADAEYNIYTAFLESFDVTEHMEDIIRNGWFDRI